MYRVKGSDGVTNTRRAICRGLLRYFTGGGGVLRISGDLLRGGGELFQRFCHFLCDIGLAVVACGYLSDATANQAGSFCHLLRGGLCPLNELAEVLNHGGKSTT
ncbi:MAG: hypothetical protein DDT38_01682 [Firmicutes bacterium]|nr:hypothetical protein [candidate division NPL-UPA2 bacterium]